MSTEYAVRHIPPTPGISPGFRTEAFALMGIKKFELLRAAKKTDSFEEPQYPETEHTFDLIKGSQVITPLKIRMTDRAKISWVKNLIPKEAIEFRKRFGRQTAEELIAHAIQVLNVNQFHYDTLLKDGKRLLRRMQEKYPGIKRTRHVLVWSGHIDIPCDDAKKMVPCVSRTHP